MALYRTISMSFWTDSKVVDDFTPEDRYFYLYLFTNPHTNLCGCYEISTKQVALETGYSRDVVDKLIKRFEAYHNVIRYSPETKEILLLNWYKYNWTKSEKFRKPLLSEISNVKNKEFREYLAKVVNGTEGYGTDTVSIPYPYGMDTSVTVTVTNTDIEPLPDSNYLPENDKSTQKIVSIDTGKRGVRGEKTNSKAVLDSDLSTPVKDKVNEWLQYKRERREDYKPMGLKSLITQVGKHEKQSGGTAVIDVIDFSMAQGYKGILWDRIDSRHVQPTGADVYFEMAMEGRRT